MTDIPPYQELKLVLTDLLNISRDGFHILLGFFVFLLFAALFRLPLSSWKALVAPLLFGIVLEFVDVRDSLAVGIAINWLDSLHDLIISLLLPLCVICYLRIISLRDRVKTR